MDKYGKKSLHVIFPLSNQDVAGIRTKEKAAGLKFYEPELYGGQHEVVCSNSCGWNPKVQKEH
jgi:hypothetical protein